MKFRLVWMGQEDDGNRDSYLPTVSAHPQRTWYGLRGGGMIRCERSQNSRVKITLLSNFVARIVTDIVLDDGEQARREFEVEANLDGVTSTFRLSASEFRSMNWVLTKVGPRAILYPGQQQHARAAIQWLSGAVRQERTFTHLGWRKHSGHWVYLHAGGAFGQTGKTGDVQAQLPSALQFYHLPSSSDANERARSIRASLRCLSLAPDRITLPLLASVYRAVFGNVDFSMFLVGKTGVFKSALAALAQQHFGAAMDATRLPGNFASTANALESLAFHAKDALLVVDDFAPTGRHGDEGLESVAERLFRAAGNQQGRSRMVGNGRLQHPRPPRALLLATGEEVPQGHSIRARLLIVEVAAGGVDRSTLSECQAAGEQGRLAASMSAFISWIAGRYDELQRRLQTRALEIRSKGCGRAIHARLPAALAELQSGWELWLEFALETGAIGPAEKSELEQRGERAIKELATLQACYHQNSDPALRFVALLQAALAGGRAHVANRKGIAPESPESCGWRLDATGQAWVPHGTRIGWITGSDLYLEPMTSFQTVQTLAGAGRIPLSQQTLYHGLHERGMLASVDPGRQMVQIRRTLEGQPRQVLHLRATDVLRGLGKAGGGFADGAIRVSTSREELVD